MKVVHGSLKNLLQEVTDKKGDSVRVAAPTAERSSSTKSVISRSTPR